MFVIYFCVKSIVILEPYPISTDINFAINDQFFLEGRGIVWMWRKFECVMYWHVYLNGMNLFFVSDLSLDIPVQYHNIKVSKGKENLDQPVCKLSGNCCKHFFGRMLVFLIAFWVFCTGQKLLKSQVYQKTVTSWNIFQVCEVIWCWIEWFYCHVFVLKLHD